jgi:hypothetical protein
MHHNCAGRGFHSFAAGLFIKPQKNAENTKRSGREEGCFQFLFGVLCVLLRLYNVPAAMLILQALILWLIVSTLMIGGAMIFHRFFPAESPWFGLIVPPLALVVLLNFIEHFVALPVLLVLLPLFLGATVWMMVSGGYFKEPLILPSAVFLVAFAFTFGVRCLHADISYTSDGISDLNMINNFSQGRTLPPPDCWMPPFRFEWYYDLQHYAASVVERLLAVKIGVAYNVSHALLSALICVVGAAAAHRISGGKLWVTLAVPFLIESAATGSSASTPISGCRPTCRGE